MKIPHSIRWYPLDVKRDAEGEGLWFYIPGWICRAFKLKDYGTNYGKVCFEIHRDKRAMIEYMDDNAIGNRLWRENWCAKIQRERKKKREG